MNARYQAARRRPPLSDAQHRDIARRAAPRRLNGDELADSGYIRFPLALHHPIYQAQRDRLGRLFVQRANEQSATAVLALNQEIRRACDGLLAELRRQQPQHATNEYCFARDFVTCLKYETTFNHPSLLIAAR
jgi:hypothetical protein